MSVSGSRLLPCPLGVFVGAEWLGKVLFGDVVDPLWSLPAISTIASPVCFGLACISGAGMSVCVKWGVDGWMD